MVSHEVGDILKLVLPYTDKANIKILVFITIDEFLDVTLLTAFVV